MKLVCLACSGPQIKVTSIVGKKYNTMYTIFNEIAIESIDNVESSTSGTKQS